MKEIGSREFQISYQKLTEPVKVVTRSGAAKTLGFFYPGEMPPIFGTQESMFAEPPEDRKHVSKTHSLDRRDELEDIL